MMQQQGDELGEPRARLGAEPLRLSLMPALVGGSVHSLPLWRPVCLPAATWRDSGRATVNCCTRRAAKAQLRLHRRVLCPYSR